MCSKTIHTCKRPMTGVSPTPLTPLEIQVFVHIFLLKIRLWRPPFPLKFPTALLGKGNGTK